jgi:hypothetical protein
MINSSKIRRTGEIRLQYVNDSLRGGALSIAEAGREIPFEIRRCYTITGLHETSSPRGFHAHRHCRQVIFCLSGSFTLHLDDGQGGNQSLVMNDPSQGILLEPLLWHVMSDFSGNCVILVLADSVYDEADYIRTYQDFLQATHDTLQ